MIQKIIAPLLLLALASCAQDVETASTSGCAPADRAAQVRARAEVFAAERSLQSVLVGGSHFAAAKVPVMADPAEVEAAKARLNAARNTLAAAGAVCGVSV